MAARATLIAVAAAMLAHAQSASARSVSASEFIAGLSDSAVQHQASSSQAASANVMNVRASESAFFVPLEEHWTTPVARRLHEIEAGQSPEATKARRLSFYGKDSLGGDISFEAKASVRDEVFSLDSVSGIDSIVCSGESSAEDALVVRIRGTALRGELSRLQLGNSIVVAGSKWGCGPSSDRASPLYARLSPSFVLSTAVHVTRVPEGGEEVVLRATRVDLTDCFHAFAMDLKRTAPVNTQPGAVSHNNLARSLVAGSLSSGFAPFTWEFNRHSVGKATWNVAPMANGTADPAVLSVASPRIPISNEGGHVLTCVNCYAWVAADVSVRGDFGWGSATTLEVTAGVYTSARFEIEAILNQTITQQQVLIGYVNTTTFTNVTGQGPFANETVVVEGWTMVPRYGSTVTDSAPATLALLHPAKVMTIEFMASGVPVAVPVTVRMDLGLEMSYSPPNTTATSNPWNGVVTGAGVEVSGRAVMGTTCITGKGCGPARREGLAINALRPLYDLPGPGSTRVSVTVSPSIAVTASVFGGWDVTMTAQPYSKASAVTGPEVAKSCSASQNVWGPVYNNSRVYASLARGMTGSVHLAQRDAALTLGAACKDGQGCAGPFTFYPGPIIPGSSPSPVTLGPYALVPEDAVPAAGATGCVGNGLALPNALGMTNLTQNISSICQIPHACDYEVGDFDNSCDVDCGDTGFRYRLVRCRVRWTTPTGTRVTFLAPKEACLASPTAPRQVPPDSTECLAPVAGGTPTPNCGAAKIFPANPVFPGAQCNDTVSSPFILSASRGCPYVPEIGAWVFSYCTGSGMDVYICPKADCNLLECTARRNVFQLGSSCSTPQNLGITGGLITYRASCPVASVGNPVTDDYLSTALDGGKVAKLFFDKRSINDRPRYRYFSLNVQGAADSVTLSATLSPGGAQNPPLSRNDFIVFMATSPFACSDNEPRDDICTPTGIIAGQPVPITEGSGLDAEIGAVDGRTMIKTVSVRSTSLPGWSKYVFVAVRCNQLCTITGSAYARSAPGQGFVAPIALRAFESRQLLYRPGTNAIGMSVMVTTTGDIGPDLDFRTATVLVKPTSTRYPFAFPKLTELGMPNITAAQELAANSTQLVPASYRSNLNVRVVTKGLTLLTTDGFSPSAEYLVNLISIANDTVTQVLDPVKGFAYLLQAFDLVSLTPGVAVTTALPANSKVAYVITVPGSATAMQVVTTPARGTLSVCVSPGVGTYDLRACGTLVNGVDTVNVPAAGTSWMAGSMEITVLVSAVSDSSYTIVALPLEALDAGVPVTRTVKRGSRLTFSGPSELPASPQMPASDRTGYERLSWAAALRVAGQAPSTVSMFAGTLSQYPNLPSDAGAEASAQGVSAGQSAQVAGQYAPYSRVQPVMLSVVPSTHSTLLTGTFNPESLLTSEQAAAIPVGPLLLQQSAARRLQDVVVTPGGASMSVNAPDMYIYAPWANAYQPGNASVDACSMPGLLPVLQTTARDYSSVTCAQVWVEPAWTTATSVANGGITYMVILPPSTQAQVQLLAPFNPSNSSTGTPTVPPPLWSVCAGAPVTSSACTSPSYGTQPTVALQNCGSAPRGFQISVQALTPLPTILEYTKYLYITVAHRPASPSIHCPTYRWKTSPWSKCGDLCKESTQTRSVMCVDELSGETVGDELCPREKPSFTRMCMSGPCVPLTSPWSECSRPCVVQGDATTTPYQYRTAVCVNGGGQGVVVPDALCTRYEFNVNGTLVNTTTIGSTPLSQVCSGLPTCVTTVPPANPVGYWWTADWSACSAVCDGGVQTRRVYCADANGLLLSDVWCLRNPRPASTRPCGVAPCAGSEVEIVFADVRKLPTGITASGLPPVVDRIPAGGMRFYSAHRALEADQAICVDAVVTGRADNCTNAALAEAASCSSTLQACLAAVPTNSSAMVSMGAAPVYPFGSRPDRRPYSIPSSVCECYAQAQACAASKRCGPPGGDIDAMVADMASDCSMSVCGAFNASACAARTDIPRYAIGQDQPVLHMYANRIRTGQTLASVTLPTGHDSSEFHMGSWAPGRQSLCINGSSFGSDVEGVVVGVKATQAGVVVAVNAYTLWPVNGTGVPPIVSLNGTLFTGETFITNVTVPPRLAYDPIAQQYLPVTNASWFIMPGETRAVNDVNVTQGGLSMTIRLEFDAFVDPNARAAVAARTYGLPLESARVHPNAMLTGLRPKAQRHPEGGWHKVALPYLLDAAAPAAVFFVDGGQEALIVLPPIPGYAPRSNENFQFTIPGQFLRSGQDMVLDKFDLTVVSTGVRDCVVGGWTEWSSCPAVPCAAPNQGNPLGGVPMPKLLQTRTRPMLVEPVGTNALQCPVLTETRPCDPCNPCVGVACDNGGVCVEGKCVCPPGYGGPDCSLPPASLSIWTSWAETSWSSCLDAAVSGDGRRFRYVNCSSTSGGPNPYIIVNQSAVLITPTPSVTPSVSATRAGTATPTSSVTPTATLSINASPSNTPSESPSSTASASLTPSGTPTPTGTASTSFTPTSTATASMPTPSQSPSQTPSTTASVAFATTSSTPSITPSNFWFNTTVNATTNATILPPPVYAPTLCGPLPVPTWWQVCPVPGVAPGMRLTRPIGNITVLRVTLPLTSSSGVNGSSLLSHSTVADAYTHTFTEHLARAAQLVPGTLLPVGVSRCAPANFVPAGLDYNGYIRSTPSVTPIRVPYTAPTSQLSGSPPAVCLTLEYVEDIPRTGVSATQLLYRLAVLFGAGVDTTARTGGVDLRPLAVTGITPSTHMLLPMVNLAPPEGRGYINYTFLAVAGSLDGRPSPYPGSPSLGTTGLLTSLPGVTPGFLPSPVRVTSEDTSTVKNALTAFIILFFLSVCACGIYYKKRGLSDRAPRPPPTKARRGTLGEVVNPLRVPAGGSAAPTTPKAGGQLHRTSIELAKLTSPAASSSSSTAPSIFTSAPTPITSV